MLKNWFSEQINLDLIRRTSSLYSRNSTKIYLTESEGKVRNDFVLKKASWVDEELKINNLKSVNERRAEERFEMLISQYPHELKKNTSIAIFPLITSI